MATEPRWARLYVGASIVECADATILEELLATPQLQPFIVARLSDRVILVDGRQKGAFARAVGRRRAGFRQTDLSGEHG